MPVRYGWNYSIRRVAVSVSDKVTELVYRAEITPAESIRTKLDTTSVPWAVVCLANNSQDLAVLTSDSREKLMRDIRHLLPPFKDSK